MRHYPSNPSNPGGESFCRRFSASSQNARLVPVDRPAQRKRKVFLEQQDTIAPYTSNDGLNLDSGDCIQECDAFAPTRRTLRQFITACHDLDAVVRDILLPNPDA